MIRRVSNWGRFGDDDELGTLNYITPARRDCPSGPATGAEHGSAARLSPHLVSRGMLLDLPRALGVDWLPLGYHVTVADLERALELGRVEPRPGDILLLRTGNMQRARR